MNRALVTDVQVTVEVDADEFHVLLCIRNNVYDITETVRSDEQVEGLIDVLRGIETRAI